MPNLVPFVQFKQRKTSRFLNCANGTKSRKASYKVLSQPAITCSKLTIETLEQGVKYVQS